MTTKKDTTKKKGQDVKPTQTTKDVQPGAPARQLNIYEKLIEVRRAVEFLKKEHKGDGFKYVSSSQAIGSVRAKMDELGLLLIPRVIETTINPHTTQHGKTWYFTVVKMEYTWVDSESPDDTIKCDWEGHGLDNAEKGIGKAYTYSEKYFLLKFFNVPTDKDDPDATRPEDKPHGNGKPGTKGKGKPETRPPETRKKRTIEQYLDGLWQTKNRDDSVKWWSENIASMKADLTDPELATMVEESKKHVKTFTQVPPTHYKCPGGPIDGDFTNTAACRDVVKCAELGQCEAYQNQLREEIA